MARLNKVMLIGRLTRDPETRTFANGGKVVFFGFATDNRRRNPNTGEWEDDPMFIDVKIFGRPDYMRQADLAEESLRKGHQAFLEGKLVFERWDDASTGQKRSKHVLVVDNFQFLEPRSDNGGGYRSSYQSNSGYRTESTPEESGGFGNPQPQPTAAVPPQEEEIPF